MDLNETLKDLGSKPSLSEEHGIDLLKPSDLNIFCPGISSGGFAEIRMALKNPNSTIVATALDAEGLNVCESNIKALKLENRIRTKLEDLTKSYPYKDNYFDYIYARLVLHYLSFQDLNLVLDKFKKSLKKGGHLFVVVRSEKNVNRQNSEFSYNPLTHLTRVIYTNEKGEKVGESTRYFHIVESIQNHVSKAGFKVEYVNEYEELLYKDFMRTKPASKPDIVIELHASN